MGDSTTAVWRARALALPILMVAVLVAAAAPTAAAERPWWPTVRRDAALQVPSGFVPVVGDLTGDGYDDILWYRAATPGSARDHAERLWQGRADGRFAVGTAPVQVSGRYWPVVAQVDGSGPEDVVWVASSGPSPIWIMGTDGRVAQQWRRELPRTANDIDVVDEATGRDVLAFSMPSGTGGPGSLVLWNPAQDPSDLWLPVLNGSSGSYPIVGDFDGDGHGDVFLHRPGPGVDAVAWGNGGGAFTPGSVPNVQGSRYTTVVLDADGNGADDIAWEAPPSLGGNASVWLGRLGQRSFRSISVGPIDEDLPPVAQRSLVPGGHDALVDTSPARGPWVWQLDAAQRPTLGWSGNAPVGDGYRVVGRFSNAIREDVLVYDPDLRTPTTLLVSPAVPS